MATDEKAPWGRVDDEGTVYVREADGERARVELRLRLVVRSAREWHVLIKIERP